MMSHKTNRNRLELSHCHGQIETKPVEVLGVTSHSVEDRGEQATLLAKLPVRTREALSAVADASESGG